MTNENRSHFAASTRDVKKPRISKCVAFRLFKVPGQRKILSMYEYEKEEAAETLYPDGKFLVTYIGFHLREVDEVAWRVAPYLKCIKDFRCERLSEEIIVFSVYGDNGVLIIFTDATVEIRTVRFEWCGHACMKTSKLWHRFSSKEFLVMPLNDLLPKIYQPMNARLKMQRRCKFCKKNFPCEFIMSQEETRRRNGKEYLQEAWVCYGCAERHLGVVF